jgi:hypothetical protein
MIPEHYRHHVEDLSLLVALSVKYDDNSTASDNAHPGDGELYDQRNSSATMTETLRPAATLSRVDGELYDQRESSATMTENATASDNAPVERRGARRPGAGPGPWRGVRSLVRGEGCGR